MFSVYVIRSESTGRTYIGHTQDLQKRLKEHNDPDCFSSKFTKRVPGPWLLVHEETYSTRSEAFRRERWLKSGYGRQYLKSILRAAAGTAATTAATVGPDRIREDYRDRERQQENKRGFHYLGPGLLPDRGEE